MEEGAGQGPSAGVVGPGPLDEEDDHGDLDGEVRFPLSLLDLVLLCVEQDDHLGPYTKVGTDHTQGRTKWGGMTEGVRDVALLDALGKMRIFSILNERVE